MSTRTRGAAFLLLLCTGCGGADHPTPASTAIHATTSGPSLAPTSSAALPVGVLASVPLVAGSAPLGMAADFGSIWVNSHRSGDLFRIDPTSNAVIARIDIGQNSCGQVYTAFGKVWIAHCGDGARDVVVDPTTNQVAAAFDAGVVSMAFGFGSVWALSSSASVIRVDPTSYQMKATIPVRAGYVVAGGGYIWATEIEGTQPYDGTLFKIDPVTNQVVATLHPGMAGVRGAACAFALGAVWLIGGDGTLLRIDAASGSVKRFVLPNVSPLSQFTDVYLASNPTDLWMRTSDSTIAEVDPQNGAVLGSFPADPNGGGGGLTVAFGSLWVANFATDTVWRDRLPA